ncbi:MAG: YifB family Mg chelatase-like AAA ATPase [Clostridia bacterium]|nr:YifB family Mg chelatase-like AAA ATPase [Clostridia bacterium]
MVSKILTGGITGINGYTVEVECSVSSGLSNFEIVGLPDASVKEARERVLSAISSAGFDFPLGKVTVNLAPGNIRKEGSGFDLPIALSVLICAGALSQTATDGYMFFGELSLDGSLRPLPGVLPMVIAARELGYSKFVLPADNALEAAIVKDVSVFGAGSIHDIILHLSGVKEILPFTINEQDYFSEDIKYAMDFAHVKGQESVKRGLEIAAAGGHNCIMSGPPGSGKTMLARSLPSILPTMTFEEALEVTKIHSIAGALPQDKPFMSVRPFRAPHHSLSSTALTGGGRIPKPGEVSLAHNGVLFLDEFPEFSRNALEILRQPLEDGEVTVSRVNATVTYPSNFILIAAMNPCPCGYFGDPSNQCTCSINQIHRYLSKISGPLLDRIDIQLTVQPVKYEKLTNDKKAESSEEIRKRVNAARKRQLERYKDEGIYCNADLSSEQLERFCPLGEAEKTIMEAAYKKFGLSARAYTRIIKVARTIADLAGDEDINYTHIAEAINYRSLDKTLSHL